MSLDIMVSSKERTIGGCLLVEENAFNPSNNPDNILSKKVEFWVSVIESAVIIPLLFLVGVPGNVLSAIVFYKQGLKDRINMCIFSLAVVDVLVLTVTFLLSAEEAYRQLIGPSSFFITYFVGFTGFTWVSMFLSAVIASERCFCVVSPFRAHRVLSTSTMTVIVIVVSTVLVGGMLAIAGHKHTTDCVFDPATNTTSEIISVTEYYLNNKEIIDIFDVFIYSTTFPFLVLLIITITTGVTASRLRNALAWRQRSVDNAIGTITTLQLKDHGNTLHSRREVALTKMLIVTSLLFIVCLAPMLLVQVATFLVPNSDLSYEGRYYNLYSVLWKVISACRCINSSLNFFVYYKMGSKFRETLFKSVLSCRRRISIHAMELQPYNLRNPH